MTKGRFRNAWVRGGGGLVTFLSTELEIRQCKGQSNAQRTADYSESESSSLLMPPRSSVPVPLCMLDVVLQINADACGQKLVL